MPTKTPQDHLPPATARQEALNEPVTFTFDGDEFTVTPSDATGLEFLAALEDQHIIKALRLLLGTEQADRLIKGRKVDALEGFFDTLGEAVGTGNL
jgi:hypothetical protein